MQPCEKSIVDIYNPYRIKLLSRLHLGLSHFHDHKFRHCFQDTANPSCDCGMIPKQEHNFNLHCPRFLTLRQTLLNNIRNINEQILYEQNKKICLANSKKCFKLKRCKNKQKHRS